MRPYEAVPGTTNAVHRKWVSVVQKFVSEGYPSRRKFKQLCRDIISDFDNIEILDIKKPRVGVVGEILVKFLPAANNHLVDLLEAEGAEAVVPDLIDFMQYCFYNQNFKVSHLGFKKSKALLGNLGIKAVELAAADRQAKHLPKVNTSPRRRTSRTLQRWPPRSYPSETRPAEGWFLTGEMLELIHSGAGNIVCTQPFACLPNHVVGKGVIKELRRRHPESNIVAIDFDPGASEVNQLNRIKLMLSTAFKNLEK